jgi:hypothetical protein
VIRLTVLFILLGATPIFAADLPQDVGAFVARRDRCDHFRGEESDDPARSAEIRDALSQNCRGTDAELARLLGRYTGSSVIRRQLEGYDRHIEDLAPRQR